MRALIASVVTWWWLVSVGALAVSCQANRYEKWTRRVDVWTPSSGVKSLAPLDRAFSNLTAKRLVDGRLFIEGSLADGRPAAEAWDPRVETFSDVASAPAGTLPPGADASGYAVTYTPAGRVLLTGNTAKTWRGPARLFDRTWREVDPLSLPIGTRLTALDLSGGALVVVADLDNTERAVLLEPGGSRWTELPRPASFSRTACFAVAGDKVAFIDGLQPSVWDPRTGSVAPLPGPRVNRNFAATVSLPDLRVLIAGGEAEVPETAPAFYFWCAGLAAWIGVGVLAGARALRPGRSVHAGEAALSRRPLVVGMLVGLAGAMTIGVGILYLVASVHR